MRQPIKPPTASERKMLREQYGFTDEEIDRDYQAAIRPAKDATAAQPRAATSTPPKAAESWSTRGKALSGARELAQGALFGLGEEAEAALGALSPNRTYGQEVARIRGEMGEFREAYPKTAMGLNVVGGFLSPVPGGGARTLGKTALVSALEGAASAAGSAEGGLRERGTAALFGGATGGVLGPIMSQAARGVASRAQRMGKGVGPDVASVSRRAVMAGYKTPEELGAAAKQLATDVPDARVLDVLGAPGARRARAIRSYGGEAGTLVEKKIAERAGEKTDSFNALLTRVTGTAPENAVETIEESIKRGAQESAPLYNAFLAQGPKESKELDAILATPFGRSVIERAKTNAANQRRQFIVPGREAEDTGLIDEFGEAIFSEEKAAQYIPQSLNDIKQAMDDIIYEGKFGSVQAGQGGARPGELRTLKKLRKEFVDEVDNLYPETYPEARAAWAGEKSLRDAFEEGASIAGKKADPRQIANDFAGLSDSERSFFKRGHLDGMRRMIEEGQTLPIGNKAFQQRIQVIYGKDADQVIRSLKAKDAMVRRDVFISGGSQTADKLADAAEDAANASRITQLAEAIASPRSAAIRGLGALERSLISPRFDARRLQEAQALFGEARNIGPLLSKVGREIGVQRRAGKVAAPVGSSAARTAGLGLGRLFVPPQEEP